MKPPRYDLLLLHVQSLVILSFKYRERRKYAQDFFTKKNTLPHRQNSARDRQRYLA